MAEEMDKNCTLKTIMGKWSEHLGYFYIWFYKTFFSFFYFIKETVSRLCQFHEFRLEIKGKTFKDASLSGDVFRNKYMAIPSVSWNCRFFHRRDIGDYPEVQTPSQDDVSFYTILERKLSICSWNILMKGEYAWSNLVFCSLYWIVIKFSLQLKTYSYLHPSTL